MHEKFKNISFIKFRGYGTFLEKFFIKIFSNKFYILRDYTGRNILTKSGNYGHPDYKETYLEVCKELDFFYEYLNKEKLIYKNVNILEIAKRNFNQKLVEYKNNIHQLKEFQKKNKFIYKVEYKLIDLFKNHNVNCKLSIILTVLYFTLDLLYFIYYRIRRIFEIILENEIKQEEILYQRKNSEHGINIFASEEKYLKLLNHLDNSFNPFLIIPEEPNAINFEWSKVNYKRSKYAQKKTILKKYKKLSANFKKDFLKYDKKNLLKLNINNLDEQIIQNISKYLMAIDTYNDVYSEIKPNASIVGINVYWKYNILIQLAKFYRAKIIYFQDVPHFEDYFFEGFGTIFTSSKTYKSDLIKFFNKKDNDIHVSYDFNNFLLKSPNDVKNYVEQFSIEDKIAFKNKLRINRKKKIALIAGDPGDTYNSKEHKFFSEYNSLLDLKDFSDYHTILKLHPQDKTAISRLAKKYANNQNITISSDIDIYKCLALSDIVISKYSTVVLEAIMLKKFVILTNFENASFYKYAVKYNVAHYACEANDVKKLIINKDNLMKNYDQKLNTYLTEVYSPTNQSIDISKTFKEVIDRDTIT